MKRNEINSLIEKIFKEYPNVKCALDFSSPFELLVASRLSAQCLDSTVNKVTKNLFAKYKTPQNFAEADSEDIENLIFSCGLYRTKARDIIAASKQLCERETFPKSIEEFCKLQGVGRKIANLMMGEIYGDESVLIADTHCIRLSNRIGLCDSENPISVEKTLKKILPENSGFHYSHAMVAHGRKVCRSQNPKCEECFINDCCKFYKNKGKERCNTKK